MQHKRACEDLSHTMSAILSNFGAPEGRWHDGGFHESGRTGTDAATPRAHAPGLPRRPATALDRGRGVGQLKPPRASGFEHCIGLDISKRMIIAAARGTDSPGLESTLYNAARAG